MAKIGKLFLDSGAFSLFWKYRTENPGDWHAFFRTPEFWKYVDQYAKFVIKYQGQIDYYANVDVIRNPEETWKIQKYLEQEHGLSPVPVIHFGTDLKWVFKYVETGYKYIGIGGIGKDSPWVQYINWADPIFDFLCPKPDRMPMVKTHGFAMTSWRGMVRYPWFSIDSTTWAKAAGYGDVIIPSWDRNGNFVFDKAPKRIGVSKNGARLNFDRKVMGRDTRHYNNFSKGERKIVNKWFDRIGIPVNLVRASKGAVYRRLANLCFFRELASSLPYPRQFKAVSLSVREKEEDWFPT